MTTMRPRYAIIACEVLFRECCLLAAAAGPIIDIVTMPQGLHNTPPELRKRVQEEIDRLEAGGMIAESSALPDPLRAPTRRPSIPDYR